MAVVRTEPRDRQKKTRPSSARPRSGRRVAARTDSRSQKLPGWKELSNGNERRRGAAHGGTFLERIPTVRFALTVVALAVLFTLYVGHVHATQDLLAQVQQERRENLRLHLQYNRLKGDFDQMVGPSVIYRRAHNLGLIEDPSFGPTIEVGE